MPREGGREGGRQAWDGVRGVTLPCPPTPPSVPPGSGGDPHRPPGRGRGGVGAGCSWRLPVGSAGGDGVPWGRGPQRGGGGSAGARGLRGQGCGDGRVLVLILALVLLPHSHAPRRGNFGLCFF